MKKLCGSCAQQAGTSLKDRMQLAKSREMDVIYNCPGCGKDHSLNHAVMEPKEIMVQAELFPLAYVTRDR